MLTLKKRIVTELPYEVLEQAHWRPSEAQLCCKYKPQTSATAEYQRLRAHWRQKEVNVNFSLDALLMCLRPSEAGSLARELSNLDFGDTFLVDGYYSPLKKIIGVPDFVLTDSINCILGENKLTASFSWNQFIKYQTFALLCRASNILPSNIVNVILVRDTEPRHFLSDFSKNWKPVLVGNELALDSLDKESAYKPLRANVDLLLMKLRLGPDSGIAGGLSADSLIESATELLPTIALSWKQFVKTFEHATSRPDLSSSAKRILELATGTFEVERSC